MRKADLYLNVTFAELWMLGYLHRGGDRWMKFKKELLEKLKALKNETPCRLHTAVFFGASDIGYRVEVIGAYSASAPVGSKSKEVRRKAEEIVGEHMREYTFKYEKGERT